jgi:soluble lytic murein transglycosylase-like protein
MDAAILEVADQLEKTINEYSVAAVKNSDGDYIHQWVVVSEKSIDETDFAERLDKALKDANKNYGVARSKALKGIKVKAIGKEVYYNFLAEGKKKGGQVKTPKVMGEEKMKNFMDFIQKS